MARTKENKGLEESKQLSKAGGLKSQISRNKPIPNTSVNSSSPEEKVPVIPVNTDRESNGRFAAGNTIATLKRNPYKRRLEEVSVDDFDKIVIVLKDACLKGDIRAIHLLFQYLMPSVEKNPFPFKKLETKTIQELSNSMDIVIDSVTEGEIDTQEAQDYMKILEAKRGFIYTEKLEKDLAETNKRVDEMKATMSKQNAAERLKRK